MRRFLDDAVADSSADRGALGFGVAFAVFRAATPAT
jgi:hypothetical protein